MSNQALPILYSFRRCPYAMRARMALIYAGIDCQLREVDLKNKPQGLIETSPKATVPVLVLADGKVIDESLDIMRWALDQSDPDCWGQHFDDEIKQTFFTGFVPALMRFKYHERYADEGVSLDERRTIIEEYLFDLNRRLESSMGLSADRLTFNDVAIFPFMRQCRLVDVDWFDALPYPAAQRWLRQIMVMPCYEQAMVKQPIWQAGDEPVKLMQQVAVV